MIGTPPIYRASATTVPSCLQQGEVISEVEQVRLDLATVGTQAPAVSTITHSYAIVMSQDCDLEQDFKSRGPSPVQSKQVPCILFCEVWSAAELRDAGEIDSTIWAGVKVNKNERYHFLQLVDPSCDAQQIGLSELGIDFKRFFAIPTDEVYRRIELGLVKRRCVLVSPYLEHLSSRFAYFLSRVALPQDHAST